jgi:hypothetical protein
MVNKRFCDRVNLDGKRFVRLVKLRNLQGNSLNKLYKQDWKV